MPYAAGRVLHDADSHVMEPADWLVPFAEEALKDRFFRRDPPSTRPPVEAPKEKVIEGLIAGPKGRLAYGAYDPAERVVATLHPNHTYEKVVFDPWQQTTYDVNDTCAVRNAQTGDPRTDPTAVRRVVFVMRGGVVYKWVGSRAS